MWQHEIIESCKERNAWFKKSFPFWCMSYKCQDFIDVNALSKVLMNASCIYFGKSNAYSNIIKPLLGAEVGISSELPFDCFLVEYEKVSGPGEKLEEGKLESSKRAMLVTTTKAAREKGFIDPTHYLYGEHFVVNGFFYIDKFKRFEHWPVAISGKANSCQYASWPSQWFSPQYQAFFYEYPPDKEEHDKLVYNLAEELGMLKVMIDFLNCKNVYTETIVPDEMLNRKREKKAKSPMVEYKVLKIAKGIPKVKYTSVEHQWNAVPRDIITAQHICRGHFKEYTPERPLLGKYSGRFWWGPQVRGSEKNGKIIKEYHL